MNGVWAIRGVDMSLQQCQTASLENWRCLKRNGFDFGRSKNYYFEKNNFEEMENDHPVVVLYEFRLELFPYIYIFYYFQIHFNSK